MKLAIINTLYAPNNVGGAEKSVQALAEYFVFLGHDVIVICLGKENANYKLNGVSVSSLKIKNDFWPFETIQKNSFQKLRWHFKDSSNVNYNPVFTQILSVFNPDILLTNNLTGFSTKAWGVAKNLNIKVVHTLRDYYLQCPKSTKFKNNLNCKNLCRVCKSLSIPKKIDSTSVNYLIGISNYVLQDHLHYGYFKEIPNKVIYNGFKIDKWKIDNKTFTNTFGYIGQINKSKGIELLLESFSLINDSSWTLLIAGNIDDEYLKKLKKINNSVQITYLGYVESTSFFEMIDVLIVPSLWNEPFGRVVLESLINNKPVIASDKGGISELLSNNQNFVFTPNVNCLLNLIKKIISNSNFLNEFKFDKLFLDKFKIEKTSQQYLAVFNQILKD
ncbi:glycosyltransferase family 4 protein [Flavobacteriaceae bacterium]|nr:glycosyltransferase family 4 protein [Flavobacteriaceae bacterium]MDB9955823.1 glycosyltransferase family 4 protein [Flavobacteriaceae bacterium]